MKKCLLIYWFIFSVAQSSEIVDVSHQWEITHIHGPSQVGIVESLAVDINDDGWVDVVSASIEDGHIRYYLNPKDFPQGDDLNFEQQVIDTELPGVYRLIAKDINHDMRIDLVATSIDSQTIHLYTQQPDHSFVKTLVAEQILLPTDVIAGDFNNDGRIDLISTSFESNTLYFHPQSIDGSFSTQVLATDILRPRKLTQADFNNDGFEDFAVASSEDNSVRVFFNKNAQGWDTKLLSDQSLGTRFVTSCDFDNNGWQDLLVSETANDTIILYRNNGDWPYKPLTIDTQAVGVTTTLCQDLDNDNQLDIAAIHLQSGNIYHYPSTSGHLPQLVANTRDGYLTLAAADFKNINQNLILTQAHFEQRNLLYHPLQTNQEEIIWQNFPDGAYYAATGDLNNDGFEDITYAAFLENKVYWAEYTENGYDIHVIFNQVDGPQSVSTGDIDHDGDIDIITAGAWDDTFWLHRNNGQGAFSTDILYSDANNAARSQIIDINGDDFNDVVITSSLDDSLRWIDLSQGNPQVHLISDQMDGALSFDVADFDQDGNNDIALGNFFGNNVVIFKQNGNNFSPFVVIEDIVKPVGVFFSKQLDLFFASSTLGDVSMLDETMVLQNIISTNHTVQSIQSVSLFSNATNQILSIFSPINAIYLSVEISQQFQNILLRHDNGFSPKQIITSKTIKNDNLSVYFVNNINNNISLQIFDDVVFADSF